ncbi:hypothetical protein PHLCEN_2v10534 [Hermanssonia centrifuga]|uniref:Uncharacterized protein n=1 Tax=Hermanssonia centrifuga TaxID=98765 RepID=A0A2R6NMN9_9APHY|nr:hypothetical protein PHLCEN_2v10534 [Hermanssonia centrifuga]
MPAPIPQKPTDVELQPVSQNQSAKQNTGASRVSNQTAKLKKEGSEQQSNANHPTSPRPPTSPPATQMKKISRKSSKPIINWFQRKLAGTVRARRASDGDALRAQRVVGTRSPSLKDKHRRSSVPSVPPLPVIQTGRKGTKGAKPQQRAPSTVPSTKRNTISLDGSDDFSSITDNNTIESSEGYRSSFARDSMWSPASLREADEDASVRPLPPSSPPSPSPSHSSSSYLSDPRTFASIAASTKPTTLLSVDLTGGMAHIAQAPPTPTTLSHRLAAHVRAHSTAPSTGGSITFSALPPASPSSRPSSASHGHNSRAGTTQLNAPQHTTHHPRNNPRPSSPPMDDASVLTLASSAYAMPGVRSAHAGRMSLADDSFSHFSGAAGLGDSTSHFLLGEMDAEDERLLMEGERDGDVDASVRALRPRSSRRGSWASEASGWSAQMGSATGQPGTPSVPRDRSLWTSGSYRTGGRSVDILNDEEEGASKKPIESLLDAQSSDTATSGGPTASLAQSMEEIHIDEEGLRTPPADALATSSTMTTSTQETVQGNGASTPKKDKGQETPKVTTVALESVPAVPEIQLSHPMHGWNGVLGVPQDNDKQIVATADDQANIFVSAP